MTEDLARRVVRGTTKLALTGVGAGLGAWAATAGARRMLRRRAEEALQIAAQTPLGRVLPDPVLPDDGAEAEAAVIAEAARAQRDDDRGRDAPGGGRAFRAESGPESPEKLDQPMTADQAGAPGVAASTAEAVTEQLQKEHSVPAEPQRDDLPIPDFDNVTVGSLRARLRSLDVEQLVILREWENAHAHRLPIVTMLDNRIAKLQAGEG